MLSFRFAVLIGLACISAISGQLTAAAIYLSAAVVIGQINDLRAALTKGDGE